MSDPFGSEAAQLISAYTSAIQTCWLQIGVVALLAYEYVITFDQEVALFWKRKKTGATVLFLATRYMALLSYGFLGAATFTPMSDQRYVLCCDIYMKHRSPVPTKICSCDTLVNVQYTLSVCQYPFWAAFSGLRALALSGMNWPVATVAFVSALVPFAVDVWIISLHEISGTNVPILGCGSIGGFTRPQTLICKTYVFIALFEFATDSDIPGADVIASRLSFIVADMIVIAVTWMSWKKGMRHAVAGVVPTLSNVLMYNGTICFLVVVISNVIHLTLTLVSITTPLIQVSEVTALTDPMTAILICRFLLALQHANQATMGGNAVSTSHWGGQDAGGQDTLRFASVVIGSIGSSLDENVPASQYGDDVLEEGDAELPGSEEMIEKNTSSGDGMSMPDTPGVSEECAAETKGGGGVRGPVRPRAGVTPPSWRIRG